MCLNSKTYKGRAIMDGEVNIVTNKSSEFRQPAVQRVFITRTLVDTMDNSTLHSGRGRWREGGWGLVSGAAPGGN